MTSDNVFAFPSRSQIDRGVSVVPPLTGQSCTVTPSSYERIQPGDGGFDTVRFEMPWPFGYGGFARGGYVSFNESGEMSATESYKFSSCKLGSWSGSWAFKPIRRNNCEFMIFEGSPAKAATGQNLYLPEAEGLLRAVYLSMSPYFQEFYDLCKPESTLHDFIKNFLFFLSQARVQRLDFTTHIQLKSTEDAARFLMYCDVQGGGIVQRGFKAVRWQRVSETSLKCGTGRRWGAKLYLKQPEMVVNGHCPALADRHPELWTEAEGVVRYEYTLRSEHFHDYEKEILHWEGSVIKAMRLNLFAFMHIPAFKFQGVERTKRKRIQKDMTADAVAASINSTYSKLTDELKDKLNSDQLIGLTHLATPLYKKRIFEYELVDEIMMIEDGNLKMRNVDKQIFKMWLAGIDVWPDLEGMSESTRKRVRNNILHDTGEDVKLPRIMEKPVFIKSADVYPFIYTRSWRDLIAA